MFTSRAWPSANGRLARDGKDHAIQRLDALKYSALDYAMDVRGR